MQTASPINNLEKTMLHHIVTIDAVAVSLRKVRNSYAPHWDANLFRACDDHAKALADMFAADDKNFDRALFLKMAGVPVVCPDCAAHYGDSGVCDKGMPMASPHRVPRSRP